MTYIEEPMNRAIPDALMNGLAQSVPAGTDMWRQVQSRVATYDPSVAERKLVRAMRVRRVGFLGVGCLAVSSSLSISAMASPQVRQALTHAEVSMGIAVAPDGSLESVNPTASFVSASPAYVPAQLNQTLYRYAPPGASDAVQTSLTTFPFFTMRGEDLIRQENPPALLYLVYANNSGSQHVEIVERPMPKGLSLAAGQSISVNGVSGTRHNEGPLTITDYVRTKTHVTILSNVTDAETLRIANSMR